MMVIGLLLILGQLVLLNVEEELKLNRDNVFHQKIKEKLAWVKRF